MRTGAGRTIWVSVGALAIVLCLGLLARTVADAIVEGARTAKSRLTTTFMSQRTALTQGRGPFVQTVGVPVPAPAAAAQGFNPQQASAERQPIPADSLTAYKTSLARANSGYIYSNEAYSHLTFQVIGSRLKPGCAESKIVATAVNLIRHAGGGSQ
jgi:hypothetical protein